jgi:hypothetical protein
MKTRTYCLPLVALSLLLGSSNALCQSIPHVTLYEYFSQLPDAPSIPSTADLSSISPVAIEEHADLTALGQKIEHIIKPATGNGSVNRVIEESMHRPGAAETIAFESETQEVRRSHDELLVALNDMEKIKTEYGENFRRLEDAFHKRTEKSRDNMVTAIRDKLSNEEYLLSIYIGRMKPAFKLVDNLLGKYNYADDARSKEVKNLFRGAQKNEALILSDIIERLKLERITISNCARLAQQK